jgi:predicted PurR-regulated permease PerM
MAKGMTNRRFRHTFLLLLVAVTTVAFVAMLSAFLLTITLAVIFTGLSHPLYRRLQAQFKHHDSLAAAATLVIILTLVMVPLLIVLVAGANEAVRITQSFGPRLKELVNRPDGLEGWLQALPFYATVEPYQDEILARAEQLVGSTGALLFGALSATTVATASIVVHFVVMLYTMFFLLTDGPRFLRTGLGHLPLDEGDKALMMERFLSVNRATLKGTVLIGTAQGLLSGLAFWAVGIDGAIFWGMVMVVLSIIPGVGGAFVWVPAAIALAVSGEVWRGLGLAAFCAFVVGSIDNLLRAQLVGRDTQLHPLFIFFGTLGGLLFFGVMGFVIGPMLAALFVTVWEMFGIAFKRELASSIIASPDDEPHQRHVTEERTR